MEAQSSDISSSHEPGDTKPLEDLDDVLDLTGGAGQFSHTFPSRHMEEKEEENEEEEEDEKSWKESLEASPVLEDPGSTSGSSPTPHSPPEPSAPTEEPERPPATCTAPSSSLDKIMEPSSTVSTGQEDFASVLLQSTASLSSLPSLSSKEHVQTVAFSTGLAANEALQEPTDNTYSASRSLIDHLETKALDQFKEEVIFSDKGYVVEHPTSQQETISEEHAKLYSQSAKEMFSGMLQSVAPPHEEFTDIKEVDYQYVDFKPFISSNSRDIGYEVKDVAEKFDVGRLNLESTAKYEEKSSEEKEMDISDDISPLTPEVLSDSTDYEMFATVEHSFPFSLGGSRVAGNKTDEKKIEDFQAQKTSVGFGLKVATVNPFYDESAQESEYVTTGATQVQVSTKAEGPTPDIVQEAYESEAYDTGISKLNYEPNIDLVQTAATSMQEKVSPTAQVPALLEDSVSSPVLPDIVMEAPLASTLCLETMALKPDISPVRIQPPARDEKTKAEPEKPPSYEEAVTEVLQDQDPAAAADLGDSKQRAVVEEAEAPYISIACDLIKGTQSAASDFTEFSKFKQHEFDSQFMEPSDESSPDSELSEPSYKQWDSEVVRKETFSIKTESAMAQSFVIPEQKPGIDQKSEESSPSKPYLDSFQPEIYVSKATDLFAKGLDTEISIPQERHLHMEEFDEGLYSSKLPGSKYSPVSESPEFRLSPEELTSKHEEIQTHIAKQPEDQLQKNKDKLDFLPENIEFTPIVQKADDFGKAVSDTHGGVDTTAKGASAVHEEKVTKPEPPSKKDEVSKLPKKESKAPSSTVPSSDFRNSVVDLIYWRDIKRSGVVFGASLFLLLSLSVFSIVSVLAYIALALLSVTISFRIYKGVLQAIQKSEEGHPFRSILESNLALPEDVVQKYCTVALNQVNRTVAELRRLFLVEDLVDSLKFAVLMWVFTYIGALFNGLTLLIVALISLFSIPVIYERHQTQVDHYLALINKNLKNTSDLILAKVPGLKRKSE
ncbi:reticulon 4 L homeolog isoform X2 [Xenopus laevis]|uniref:Reticulon n=1 Tax=Xenopus laevis TaxID=8355 RepID=A0A8J0VDL2_XENLA|nr:reticulon 4 L homeolog isoform X2 [Xenopus laevis]